MKKFAALLLTLLLAVSAAVMSVSAIEENDPVEITVHFKNAPGAEEVGLITIGATYVMKDLGGGLIANEYGWSQFDGPFPEDDFGIILQFTAGYIETDVSEIAIRTPGWEELAVVHLPINSQTDGKIEIWVTGVAGSTNAEVSYSPPGAATPADEPAPAAADPAPAAAAPANPRTGDSSIVLYAVIALIIASAGLFTIKKAQARG